MTTRNPYDRDAWQCRAVALYRLERWNDLVPVAHRLVQIDPLNYEARIILFNAHKGISDAARAQNSVAREQQARDEALRVLAEADGLPVRLDPVRLLNPAGPAQFMGTVMGRRSPVAGVISLAITLYGAGGTVVGTHTHTLVPPPKDTTAPFTVTIPVTGPVYGWAYSYR